MTVSMTADNQGTENKSNFHNVASETKFNTPVKRLVSSTKKNGTPNSSRKAMSAKARVLSEKKANSAKKIREEKKLLREQKKKNEQAFLLKAAQRREEVNRNSQIRKEILKKEKDLAMALKQKEISERQWALEQHRLWKVEQRKMELEEKRKSHEKSEAARMEREEYERMENENLERQKQADYNLEKAAHEDVQNYIKREKQKRRDSIAFRLKENSEYKQHLKLQKEMEKIQKQEDDELERLAYEDMKKYIASEKEQRRLSLANFLQQESDYRKKQEYEHDIQYEKDLEDRKLENEAYNDVKNYEQKQMQCRRLSLANKLQVESEHTLKMLKEEEQKAEQMEHITKLKKSDELSVKQGKEEASYAERQLATSELEAKLDAMEEEHKAAESELVQLEEKRAEDIKTYSEEVIGEKEGDDNIELKFDSEATSKHSDFSEPLSPLPSPPRLESAVTSDEQSFDIQAKDDIATTTQPVRATANDPPQPTCCVLM